MAEWELYIHSSSDVNNSPPCHTTHDTTSIAAMMLQRSLRVLRSDTTKLRIPFGLVSLSVLLGGGGFGLALGLLPPADDTTHLLRRRRPELRRAVVQRVE
eukprot:7387309-Prymnesium_polylepis.2